MAQNIAGSGPQWTPNIVPGSPSFQGDVQDAVNRLSQNVCALQQTSQPAAAQATSGQPYDITFNLSGKPGAGTKYHVMTVTRSLAFPGNLSGSQLIAGTFPTGTVTMTVSYVRSGTTTPIGNISVNSTGVAQFSTPQNANQSAEAGDLLILTAPSPQDATFSDMALTLVATRE